MLFILVLNIEFYFEVKSTQLFEERKSAKTSVLTVAIGWVVLTEPETRTTNEYGFYCVCVHGCFPVS